MKDKFARRDNIDTDCHPAHCGPVVIVNTAARDPENSVISGIVSVKM